MTDSKSVEFTKMQGTGNDFLVVDNRLYEFSRKELSRLAARWCRRRYGVGADGLVALGRANHRDADYRMLYVNADGSTAPMCGNGARCLVRYADAEGGGKPEVTLETDAGLYHAEIREGTPEEVRLYVQGISEFRADLSLDQTVPPEIKALHFARTGTEHLVAFVDDLSSIPVQTWGRNLRRDPLLEPAGANVNFVQVDRNSELHVRTYEKGVEAETLSCGTGVVAAALIAEDTGRVDGDPLPVHTEGGRLQAGTAPTPRGREHYLQGSAVKVFQGRLESRLRGATESQSSS